jgi:hypothetical protein
METETLDEHDAYLAADLPPQVASAPDGTASPKR